MTGFFNPQGFLTAMRQEITRAHKGWALDAVVLDNDVTKLMKEDITSAPSEGNNLRVARKCHRCPICLIAYFLAVSDSRPVA